jgi:hypothetical protein
VYCARLAHDAYMANLLGSSAVLGNEARRAAAAAAALRALATDG